MWTKGVFGGGRGKGGGLSGTVLVDGESQMNKCVCDVCGVVDNVLPEHLTIIDTHVIKI